MPERYGVTSSSKEPPYCNNNHDKSTSGQNTYTTRPPTFSGDSTEFEWWKIKM